MFTPDSQCDLTGLDVAGRAEKDKDGLTTAFSKYTLVWRTSHSALCAIKDLENKFHTTTEMC